MVRPVLRCCSWCCSYQIVMEELRGDTPDTFDCEIRLVSFFLFFFSIASTIVRESGKRKLNDMFHEIVEGESSKAKGKGLRRLWCWIWR